MDQIKTSLRHLPSVDAILRLPELAGASENFGHASLTEAVRKVLHDEREAVKSGAAPSSNMLLAERVIHLLEASVQSSLRPLFNLTGTVLHTNLGRAILAEAAIEAATQAMRQAVSLEFDLSSGSRGERDDHLRALVCELTGAEDATVVNNNAAAVLLVLNSLATGKEAIVSRGELIEIGGAFRMPDIMTRAGTRLVEVGTTNRTHPRDYENAINPDTGLVLKVHTSNYRIEGFTREVTAPELAAIARGKGVPLVNDLGSGTLADLTAFGLAHEPTVREAVAEGADIVTFSGDKLLGGPQVGFIVGRRDLIARINKNPMKRALRVDKIRLAALEATLKLYRNPERLAEKLPTIRYLARPQPEIAAQAARLKPGLERALGPAFIVAVTDCASQIGSGALPLSTVPSAGLSIVPKDGSGTALTALASSLRALPLPIIGRIEKGAFMLDLRCLEDEDSFLHDLSSLAALRS
ncbi:MULTISPECIES: L-seryl-tRNA(Sec) selenium transferase [Brucella/Ochrobactrum group]|jgi:L-seryl-tRNA(Ser) seleniumtransferase|uniref:L-seryl-tRNA(Sec) selenium transferase n=1 Tax=Brucella pseudintermedia TaxID=370111 RepID=A0ABY5UHT2_9HYPH|nr:MULTISPECIES: L-seryl-tRNA(Sec) selenium transferase [Brucella/Ochrobactrum group]KAB2683425.1 L-seryl-tRNA(Sec) selenium transferase [Brucella pseudintermedia]MCO7728278.1 L-seryl-tRNA(Sec) selenium transferase [Brucella intermedia]NKE74085.1 L-seryl-tRNA(Sec) selenium transferase [Ochrobactrum sp. MC-1LL]TWH03556.1 L-seryl-tRNA(Sec) selenium transferase [Ochrobactrum sp. J50]UWL62923.1 L-seryl-tRNA(Sec) selenium transferase [Brucella pseudintermedia]